MTTTLTQALADYKTAFIARVDPTRVHTMEAATADLRATGIERAALQVGATAPELTLPDATGKPVRLADLWATGPLVVVFYRGGWCPYCNLELRAWQQQLDALRARGAGLVAISPQTPDNSLSTADKNALAFPVLSDSALAAAHAFGMAFALPPELVELYGQVCNDLLRAIAVVDAQRLAAQTPPVARMMCMKLRKRMHHADQHRYRRQAHDRHVAGDGPEDQA